MSSQAASRISAGVASGRWARLSRVGVTDIVRSIEQASASVKRSTLPPMAARRRKFWGWGYEGEGPTHDQQQQMAKTLAGTFDLDEIAVADPPKIDELELSEPRLEPPASLAPLCATSTRCSTSTARPGRRASRRACTAPPSRTSSVPTG